MEGIYGFVTILRLVILLQICTSILSLDLPSFRSPVENITVAVGREAVLSCAVENLEPYKVAWLKVDTQTILTIHNHVITKNNRVGVIHTQYNIWKLHIKDVRESDSGWYMCQINTDPMKSQKGHLKVVVPPDILDYPTSTDMVVDEGSNVTLQCIARGLPEPKVTWKREDGGKIESEALSIVGPILNITNVKRHHMGAYLCIASNGVPPTVSKRIKLIVQFAPTIWVRYQLIGAYDGQSVTLECHSQAYPKAINYWTRDSEEIILRGKKYEPEIVEDGYNVYMKLRINSLEINDYGIYKCISKNSVADMEGSINIYRIADPNKLLLNKLKYDHHTHHNVSTAGFQVTDEIFIRRSNLSNITYRKSFGDKDQLNVQGYYDSDHGSASFSSVSKFTYISFYILHTVFA